MPEARSRDPQKSGPALLDAIRAVGDLLAEEQATVGIVVVGGAALILKGTASRLTEDVDIIATARPWRTGMPTAISRPDPLPASLLRAVSRVARDFNLPENWMNSQVGAQWDTGLPRGFRQRIQWRRFGGLFLGIAGRKDLIFLKLYAAVNSEGPESVHYQDLLALQPSVKDLVAAVKWVKSQDTSIEFAELLDKVIEHVSRDQEEPR